MNGPAIRSAFLNYFKKNGHEIVTSSSLVPHEDPTILFTNAGMNQFKGCFLGTEKRSYTRATTAQKCMRISGKHNDFENVGVTRRHHTFFEMMGNFSFGDYFKADAIKFAWEFVTQTLGLSPNRLWVSVLHNDDEAAKLWTDITKISSDRIVRMTEKDNFWAMGDTGPCGPCSEIYYYLGEDESKQSEADFRKDDGTYLEFWNLVFMQFERSADGVLTPLPKPSVDTGLGLERMASILQGVEGNYESDLVRGVITRCEELSGHRYVNGSYKEGDLKADKEYARNVAMRVIADHSRSIAFLVADGVIPSSEGRGYVLRRLLRRAVRHGRVLAFPEPFLAETTATVVSMFGEDYPELVEMKETIHRIVDAEERKFYETLDAGLTILTREVEKLDSNEQFSGDIAFQLYDTYGFPLDLTEDALKAYKKSVDIVAYDQAMEGQRTRSRDDRKGRKITFTSKKVEGPKTEFLGYRENESEGKLLAVFEENGSYGLLFDATPFYAESGGQVGDTGFIQFNGAEFRVLDTQKYQGEYIIHDAELLRGDFSPKLKGEKAHLKIDAERRERIKANHSATHLIHSALRKILGNHVKQAGSRVDESTLRFDYSHFEPVTEEQLDGIVEFVNDYIRQDYDVTTEILPIKEAKKRGAMALFGEKYGDVVRVVGMGPESLELCGGTHVGRTGNIGFIVLDKESGISAGVRRIECFSGAAAHEQVLLERKILFAAADSLKTEPTGLTERLEKLHLRYRELERELQTAKAKLIASSAGNLAFEGKVSPSGVRVVVKQVESTDAQTLKGMVDSIRIKLGSGVVALATTENDSGILVAGVTADLASKINVGELVKQAVVSTGGRGGGKRDFAQAGGIPQANLNIALNKFFELIG